MQTLRAGASKSLKSKVQLLVPYQHADALKMRYGVTAYDIGETVGGMLMVMIARKHVREAMAAFDACKMAINVVVLSDVRRAKKAVVLATKKVAYR